MSYSAAIGLSSARNVTRSVMSYSSLYPKCGICNAAVIVFDIAFAIGPSASVLLPDELVAPDRFGKTKINTRLMVNFSGRPFLPLTGFAATGWWAMAAAAGWTTTGAAAGASRAWIASITSCLVTLPVLPVGTTSDRSISFAFANFRTAGAAATLAALSPVGPRGSRTDPTLTERSSYN